MTTHSANNPIGSSLRLGIATLLTFIFVVVETLAGLYSNSLALLTDAAHNLTDVIALVLSWYALRLATLPSHAAKTFGYHRVGILVALLNSLTLIIISLGIFYQAYQRFLLPPPVQAEVMVVIGGIAFVLNLLTAWLVSHGHQHDLNLHSAFVHLLGDVVSTLGAIVAGVGIWLTGLNWLDPVASGLIGVLILWNAWGILRETLEILLESTPKDIDMNALVKDVLLLSGVRGVHHLHVWSISRSLRMLSAHIVTDDLSIREGSAILQRVNTMIGKKYRIVHATLQLESESCEPDLMFCDMAHDDDHHNHSHHH